MQEDTECRTQFKERWTRVPSSDLQKNLRDQLTKHKKTFSTARSGDEVINKKYDQNIHLIESLCATKVS
jgi:programmed cell death 6-interacting protein